jgi:hypothetical protein
MGRNKGRQFNKPQSLVDPPLETLATLLNRLGTPLTERRFGLDGDPLAAFNDFATQELHDLSTTSIGNAEHLAIPYVLAAEVKDLILALAQRAGEYQEPPSGRAKAAGINLVIASETLFGAILLHLQQPIAACLSAIMLARGALEASSVALWIASRTGSEASEWERNDLGKVRKGDLMAHVDAFLGRARKPVPDASLAYKWMCGYAHLEFLAVDALLKRSTESLHEHSYAAITYSALVNALVAEVVLGFEGTALWPKAWPADLGWGIGLVSST